MEKERREKLIGEVEGGKCADKKEGGKSYHVEVKGVGEG